MSGAHHRRACGRVASVALVATALLLGGCQAKGGGVRVGSYMRAPVTVDEVQMHFRPVDRAHTVVALLDAQADTRTFVTIEEAEAAVYERLREQAARFGATAVIDIERTVSREIAPDGAATGNQLVSATAKAVVFRSISR